jgi:glycosyltransferase involved in cell wall biosynthesis
VYDCDLTAPWLAMKYAVALSNGGGEVKLFELGADKQAKTVGLFDKSFPVQKILTTPGGSRVGRWRQLFGYLWRVSKKPGVIRALLAEKARCYIVADPRWLITVAIVSKIAHARLVYIPFEYFPTLTGSRTTSKIWRWAEKLCAPMVFAWVSLGEFLADEYRRVYDVDNRVHVVYSSWPAQQELPRPALRKKLGLGADHCVIIYQGLITARRGLLNVVSALKELPDNVVFVILGYGPDVDLVRRKAAEDGICNRVYLLDAVPQNELIAYTCDADIGILPIRNTSRSYYFCNPGKLFECMAAGLPLAVSNLAQLEWWVRTRELGVVFNPEDPDDIARSLRRLINDDAFRKNCAANSRRTHLTETRWEIQSERLCRAVFGT